MKSKQQFTIFTLQEANIQVKRDFAANYWIFIIQSLNYPEITYDKNSDQITCPGFIPFRELALEVIDDLQQKRGDIKECEICHGYFDINSEEGIFGDPGRLEKFICNGCSCKISGRDFYDKFLVM